MTFSFSLFVLQLAFIACDERGDGVLFVERSSELSTSASISFYNGCVVKASLNRA